MRAMKVDRSPKCNDSLPSRPVDHGPAERWNHTGRVLRLTERAGVVAVQVAEEHVLDTLFFGGVISPAERAAGLRFFSDYRAAGLMERVVGSYSFTRSTRCGGNSCEDDRTDAEEAAYQRWRLAMRALGSICGDCVQSVACDGFFPAEKDRQRLKRGLGQLVLWYKL